MLVIRLARRGFNPWVWHFIEEQMLAFFVMISPTTNPSKMSPLGRRNSSDNPTPTIPNPSPSS